MNLYQVTFDATTITVVAKNKQELFQMLKDKDKGFETLYNDLYYRWGDKDIDKCTVVKVSMTIPLIIHWEAH